MGDSRDGRRVRAGAIRNVTRAIGASRHRFIDHVCRYVDLATWGHDDRDPPVPGYLRNVAVNLGGDRATLRRVCAEMNFPAELRAALLVAQKVRFDPDEPSRYGKAPTRPRECLAEESKRLGAALAKAGLAEPAREDVLRSLASYAMAAEEVETLGLEC